MTNFMSSFPRPRSSPSLAPTHTVVPFIVDELTTRAFGTAFAMGCAHSSFRTSGPWSPARRGARPPNPPVYLTQSLILLLNSRSCTLAQLACRHYSVFNPTACLNILYARTARLWTLFSL